MNWIHAKTLLSKESLRAAARGHFSWDLVISLIGFAAFAALIWYFIPIGSFIQNIGICILYAVLPVSLYKTPPRKGSWYRTLNYWNLGLTAFICFGLLLVVGAKLNLTWLGFNAAMIFVALPCLFILVKIFQKKPFLGLGMVPAAILIFGAMVVSVLPSEGGINYLFLPVPFLIILCIVWSLLSWPLLNAAKARQSYPIRGPLYEFLTMAVLFVPFIALALIVTQIISENPIWMAVSATILGVLFSSVIATPLRKLLLELAELTQTNEN